MQMVVVWGGCIFMSRGVNLLFSLFSSALRHLTKQKFTVLSSRLCRHTHAGSDVSVKNEKKMKRLNYVGAISLGTACALVLSKVRENTHIHTHTHTHTHRHSGAYMHQVTSWTVSLPGHLSPQAAWHCFGGKKIQKFPQKRYFIFHFCVSCCWRGAVWND